MAMNIGQVLRQGALRHPGRTAVVDGERAWSYRELDDAAARTAPALRASGVGRGDRVLLCAGNSAGFVSAWFGIVYAGAAVVPVPILSAPDEVSERITRARCAAAIADEARAGLVASAGLTPLDPKVLAAHPETSLPESMPPGDDAMILFTSGTTGVPRGARISHAALLVHTATLVHHTLCLTPEDRVLGVLPLTHSFGCRMAMLAPFFAGASLHLVERFHPQACLDFLTERQITWAPVVPTMLAAWAGLPGDPVPSLRWALSAGAPLPPELARRAEARLGAPVRQGYGLTEATFSTVDTEGVPGSVGRPVWGVEVRIVGPAGEPLPAGTDGEIEVRGPNQMTGYLDDPQATADTVRDGWLSTGDIGHLDIAGRLWVVDRAKDLILRGGNNVYPAEVEAVLCRHPAVAQVAVVGRPDPYYGEEVVAVVVPREGRAAELDDLATFAAGHLARTKLPRELALVDELPLGPSGKVLKRLLREQLADGTLELRKLS